MPDIASTPRHNNQSDQGSDSKPIKERPQNRHQIGEAIDGKGVYVGIYQYDWTEGFFGQTKLSRLFDVYAARQDSVNGKNYGDIIDAIAGIVNLEGHSGTRIKTELYLHKLLQAEESEVLSGQWFLPSIAILKNNVHTNRGQGILKDGFCRAEDDNPRFLSHYASLRFNNEKLMEGLSFRNGQVKNLSQSQFLSARPVRLELRK